MPPAKKQPSEPSSLLLQRRLDGDCKRWRTVLRVRLEQMPIADEWVRVANLLSAKTEWRVVREP